MIAYGSVTVIANSFQGRQLNIPNDVIVKSDGAIYLAIPWACLNGTPIKFVKPFHTIGDPAENVVAVGQIQTVLQSPRRRRRS